MTEKSEHYRKRYRVWGGNPDGTPPDFTRCCEQVHDGRRGGLFHQCERPRGHGPDGAYCKQHDPAAVKARADAATARYNSKFNQERYQWHGKTFVDALVLIANGHNDARGLAQEVIDKFNEGARP